VVEFGQRLGGGPILVPDGHFMFRGSATSLGRPRKPSLALCLVREEPCQLPSRDAGPLVLVLVILSVCALAPAPACAQAVYGSIFGTITDQSGAAVVGAKLKVTSVQKQIRFATTSNRAGNYSLTHLIPDLYDVRSEAPGFKIVESTSIPVYADQATRLDVHLQVGGTEEKVTVSAEDIPLMKTDRSDVATTFGEKEVKSLPLFNRNFTSLELLTPGTSQFGWQHASAENPQGGIQIMVNGQHFSGTSFQLDGTDNRDPVLGIIVINPTLESVTQTKVTTQNYDAEFGQALAGVVTVQTKSGTNDFHGSAFEFRRTGWGQARNPFTQPPDLPLPATKWNQFGGSLGGPLIKNRLFFFGDYQGTRRSNGVSARLNVPTALVRSTCLEPAVPLCDLSEYPELIFDPASGNQFTNNQLPRDRISSQAVNLLKLLPGPNVSEAGISQNFITSGTEQFDDDDFNIRIDHNASEKLNLFGRYSFADFRLHALGVFGAIAGGPGLSPDGFAGQSLARNQSIAAGINYVLKPDLVIDFRFGFFRYHVNVLPNDTGTTPAKDAGIPGVNLGDTLTSGMPNVFVDGQADDQFSFGHVCNCPLLENEQQFQWVTNWTKTAGNHVFKWGTDFRYAQNLRVASTGSRTGSFGFFNSRTQGSSGGGLGLATFLLGDVSGFSRFASNIDDAGERQKRWFFYGQDTFRVTRKLVLNYGLRWEIYFPQSVTGKGAGGWVDLGTGLVNVAGFGNVNLQGNVANSFTDLAPRLGIEYEATPKTVVRMGYGRSFDIGVFGSIFGHTATQNLPVLVQQQLNPSSNTGTVFALSKGPPSPPFVTVPASGQFLLPDQVGAFVLPRKLRLPTLDAWNVTVEHQITPTLSLAIGYVANKGTHVFAGDGPDYDPNQATIVGFGSLDTNERKPFFRKFGWTQPLSYFGNDASNNYNSLQVVAERRLTQGYQFLAHYTWSKALGYDSGYYAIDPRLNFGVTSTDRRHVFVLTNLVELPFGKGKRFLGSAGGIADHIVGRWSISGTTTWESGLPFSPEYSSCAVDRDTGPCRPNLVGSVHVTGSRNGYFTTTGGVPLQLNGTPGDTIGSWQRPAVGTFGSAGRNSLRGPGFFQADVSVAKDVLLKESASIQFRTDIFNLFNKVNLDNPLPCVDCPGGGIIISTAFRGAALQRQILFSLRLQF
jgi:Carboxypeptidase regulatory-like domain/TonB dependent receptor